MYFFLTPEYANDRVWDTSHSAALRSITRILSGSRADNILRGLNVAFIFWGPFDHSASTLPPSIPPTTTSPASSQLASHPLSLLSKHSTRNPHPPPRQRARRINTSRHGMGRDPKRYVVALTGFYALFQLVTQASNPATFSKSQTDPNSPWRPQR